MSHELRFQVEILPDVEWSALLERFRHVEALGFDLAVTADGFVDSMDPSRPWFDLWTLLAGVAQATDRIRIAPCVAQIPLRDPATLARQVLTVDHISNGRVEVGLGLGRPVGPSYRMMGIPNWDNPERADRFREYVEIIDRMLANEQTTYEGRHYRIEGATVHRSVQSPRPPITIAAMGPRMMRYAGADARLPQKSAVTPKCTVCTSRTFGKATSSGETRSYPSIPSRTGEPVGPMRKVCATREAPGSRRGR